jgi:hypothetical protein
MYESLNSFFIYIRSNRRSLKKARRYYIASNRFAMASVVS